MSDHNEAHSLGAPPSQGNITETLMVGDPRLHQVRNFLDEQEPPPANPLSMAARAFRGRRLITAVLTIFLATLFGAGAFFAIKPKYQSQGLIRVAARIPKIMYADPNDPRLRLFDSFVSAEVTYLQSRPVLERALGSLIAKYAWLEQKQMDIGDLHRMITVRKDKGLVTVTAIASTPKHASNTVNTLLNAYTELHAETSTQTQSIRERQLVDHEKDMLSKLNSINTRILYVGEEHGTSSIAKAHLNKVTQLEDIDHRISELETTIAQEEAQKPAADFDTGDDEIKRVTVLDKAMADMTYDRAKRAATLAAFKLRYNPDHPKVLELQTEIAVIEDAIEARRQQIVTLGTTGALTAGGEKQDNDPLKGLNALREKLIMRRAAVAEEAKKLNSKLIELTFLKEEHGEARSMLDETRRALEEVRVEGRNSLPGSVEVIATGATPRKPIEDKRKKLAVAGAGFGIFAALGLVILWRLIRPRLRYSDDLRITVGDPSMLVVLPHIGESPESYRLAMHRMRNRLQLSDDISHQQGRGLVLAICSTRCGSGVSTVAQSLAESFSVTGMKTVLVDADLNQPSLSKRLDLEQAEGLREAISNGLATPSLHVHHGSQFKVLPVGMDCSIDDEHLSLPQVRAIANTLRDQHDVVIFDVGPFEANLSASLMTALADQVVVIVRADEKISAVRRLMKWLESDAIRPPLFTLNAARADDPGLMREEASRKSSPLTLANA